MVLKVMQRFNGFKCICLRLYQFLALLWHLKFIFLQQLEAKIQEHLGKPINKKIYKLTKNLPFVLLAKGKTDIAGALEVPRISTAL